MFLNFIFGWSNNSSLSTICFLIQVLPNMASIMDIKAVSYDVCGVVRVVSAGLKAKVKPLFLSLIPLLYSRARSTDLDNCELQVALTRGPENVKPQVKQTDASGMFCFEVCFKL